MKSSEAAASHRLAIFWSPSATARDPSPAICSNVIGHGIGVAPRGSVNRPYLVLVVIALIVVDLSGCATISRHSFAEPAADWQTRTGQLMYRNARRTLIGEVFVRFSNRGN